MIVFRLAPVGEGFRRMEELYGVDARLSLYRTNGKTDHHARYFIGLHIFRNYILSGSPVVGRENAWPCPNLGTIN